VDLDVEIAKCEKKLDVAKMALAKVVKAQEDYAENVPETVRTANDEKVCLFTELNGPYFDRLLIHGPQRKTLEAEISTLEQSKEMFARLK
jgi:valyl-tRNA synthetase